ncbi:MAG: hypothetical protein ACTHOR_10165 [Devosia sp.]|nr:hypothetical protein [Devosiaceae bacterium]
MGKLVPFDKQRRAERSRAEIVGGGEVVLFTGVRYQRGTPPAPTGDGKHPARRKRKGV